MLTPHSVSACLGAFSPRAWCAQKVSEPCSAEQTSLSKLQHSEFTAVRSQRSSQQRACRRSETAAVFSPALTCADTPLCRHALLARSAVPRWSKPHWANAVCAPGRLSR